MIVLKIIGWIILAIIALVFLVLCIKVRIFAEYSEIDTRLRVQWLFLKIPVYPSESKGTKGNKTKKQSTLKTEASENHDLSDIEAGEKTNDTVTEDAAAQSDADNSETAPQAPKQKNNLLKTLYEAHGIDGLLLLLNRTFSYIGTFLGDLAKSLVIDELYIDVQCTRKDAASTAIYYGEVCSALFPLLGALISKYKVRKYDINVYPDYLAKQSSASFAVSMHLYPIYFIAITVAFGCRMLFKVLLRLIVKIFLPKKNVSAENSNNNGGENPSENKTKKESVSK